MRLHRASWVLPVARPPIPDGAVAVDRGRIAAVGPYADLRSRPGGDVEDHGDAVLLPGLVNAHTHLEWSFLRGAVGPNSDFVKWVMEITGQRLATPVTGITAAIGRAIEEISATGTVAVGEVINSVNFETTASVERLSSKGLRGAVFVELLGFQGDRAAEILQAGQKALEILRERGPSLPFHLSPHAPYSVSPALFRAIHGESARRTVHLAENREEVRFLATGDGPWREFLRSLGRWDERWDPPGVSPVRYLDGLGFLDSGTLAVHAVHVDDVDIGILRNRGVPVCLCPRSNRRLGVGRAPARKFLDAGLTVALGTDSLASNDDLDLRAEMRALGDEYPELAREEVLRAATLGGARALGVDGELGSLEPGRSARFIGVRIPGRVVADPFAAAMDPDGLVFRPESA